MVLNCLKEFGSVNKSLSKNKGTAKIKQIKVPKTNTTEKLVDNRCLDCMGSPLSYKITAIFSCGCITLSNEFNAHFCICDLKQVSDKTISVEELVQSIIFSLKCNHSYFLDS